MAVTVIAGVPERAPDRPLEPALPGCCPDCGVEIHHERDTEQFQLDAREARQVLIENLGSALDSVGAGRQGCGANPARDEVRRVWGVPHWNF